MFNLFDLMQRSQGGDAVEALARQFGLSTGQASSAVDALLPAFMLGLQRPLPNGQPPGPEALTASMARMFSPEAMQQGQAFATSLFGSAELGRKIAEQAAVASGVNPATLQQMMPAMAGMMAAGAARSVAEQGMAAWMKAFQPPAPQPRPEAAAANPFDPASMASLFGRMMGLEPDKPEPPPPSSTDLGLDAVTQFVETGREVQEEYLKSLQSLFAGLAARTEGGTDDGKAGS